MNHEYQPNHNQSPRVMAATVPAFNGLVLLYLVIAGLLVFQAIYTVYHGGLVVGNGYRIAQLEKQKTELEATKMQLKQAVAQKHSLLHIQSSDVYKEFQPMAGVVTVAQTHAVASR